MSARLATPDPLAGTEWADWTRAALPTDASPRRYTRLTGPTGQSAILLESDPQQDDSLPRFLKIAAYLREAGLAAPRVLFKDESAGTAVLSDLGKRDFTMLEGERESAADALTDVLIRLDHLAPPPALPVLDPAAAGDMVRITAERYGLGGGADELAEITAEHFARFAGEPRYLALRDVHAENLIWRPERSGTNRVGLLDFQDAFRAPRGYDLVSYLRDVRRDPSPALSRRMKAQFAAGLGLETDAFDLQCATIAAQRNLRILGVFARLIKDARKDKYRAFVARTWQLLIDDLDHPELSAWKATVEKLLPTPPASGILGS